MIYILNLFSTYIQTCCAETLVTLYTKLFTDNVTRVLSFELADDLKKYCLESVSIVLWKKTTIKFLHHVLQMSYSISENVHEAFRLDFNEYIDKEYLIGDSALYVDYSVDKMYKDVCDSLKKYKNVNEASFVKEVRCVYTKLFNLNF